MLKVMATPKKTNKTRGKQSPARAPLSRERVLAKALRMADKAGSIESLSMRTLAQALKVEAMSLYNHVDGKQAILDGLVDIVAGEIDVPEVGDGVDWQAAMRARAYSAHAVLMRHRWATTLFMSGLNIGPNMLRYVDATIGCLRAAGFSYPMADHAWNTLDAYIYGFTMQRLTFPLDPSEYATAAAGFLHMIPVERFPWLNGMSQEVIAGRHDGVQELGFGLELLLEGLERMRAASTLRS
jgi:AcrR family transcriptional regulator